jgi:hypothetical protein
MIRPPRRVPVKLPHISELPRRVRSEVRPVTIAIGFNCSDSILLCADTQLTVAGVTKMTGTKLFREEYPNAAKSVIAISGALHYARMAMQQVEEGIADLGTGNFPQITVRAVRDVIKAVMLDLYQNHINQHPDRYTLGIQLLVAAWSPPENRAALFSTQDTAVNILRGYQPNGSGDSLAHYVIINMGYRPTMAEAQVRPIAVAAVAKAKDYVDGCGGFTELISLSRSGALGTTERLPTP